MVFDFGEAFERLAADSLSRRIWRCKFRVLLLELEELTEQPIVLGVRDFRRVFNVVEIVVILDLLPKIGDASGYSVYVNLCGHQLTLIQRIRVRL
jgi:hypothetical protein